MKLGRPKPSLLVSLLSTCAAVLSSGTCLADTLYVWTNSPYPGVPYNAWTNAAHTIQEAVDAASTGDTVVVTDGVYQAVSRPGPKSSLPNRVVITNAITVISANGPGDTVIAGRGPSGTNAVRCAFLSGGAVLSGFTLTNGHVMLSGMNKENRFGGGVYIDTQGAATNCLVTGNEGSGAFLHEGGLLDRCTVRGNQGGTGGGATCDGGGSIRRCIVAGNTAAGWGGGIDLDGGGLVAECLIAANKALSRTAGWGGGVSMLDARMENCTVAWNTSPTAGGGLICNTDAEIVNSIIYHNDAPVDPNVRYMGGTIGYCCTTPDPGGVSNITADPLLIGIKNPHLAAASPCRDKGDTNDVTSGMTDFDGESRVDGLSVDIGCDEFIGTNITGGLAVTIVPEHTNILVNTTISLFSDIEGKAHETAWLIATNGGFRGLTNVAVTSQAWDTPGTYPIVLTATNLDVAMSATVDIHVVSGFTNYVSLTGGHAWPFTNWTDAATNAQDAIDACHAGGGVVLVNTGAYRHASEVAVNKAIIFRAAYAREDTVFNGANAHRVISISAAGAVLDGLTITNGYAEDGGGVWLTAGTVTNCVLSGNYAETSGGGILADGQGVVANCTIAGNRAGLWGGGVMGRDGSVVRNGLIHDNRAENYGGGINFIDTASAANCFIVRNRSWGGGGVKIDNGLLRNCTIIDNTAVGYGGGLYMRRDNLAAANCVIYHNKAGSNPNWYAPPESAGYVEYCCTTPDPGTPGIVTNAPLLAGIDNGHIVQASPCIDAGRTNDVEDGDVDLDGEARIGGSSVDIGCDEYIGTNILGALDIAVHGETNVVVGSALPMVSGISGKASIYEWVIATNGGTLTATNALEVDPAWDTPGFYDVVLLSSNLNGSGGLTVTVHVVGGGYTNYVSHAGSHTAPFTNWGTAATSIQVAVDACYVGGVTLIDTGVYVEADTLLIERGVAVAGAFGRDVTIIDGGGLHRCVHMDNPGARLSGLTITNGYAIECAGIYLLAGAVSNCVISGNISSNMCGGIECHGSSQLRDSTISGNQSWNWPGGVWCSGEALVQDCHILGNLSMNEGGGVYVQGGTVRGCRIEANSSRKGGGVMFIGSGIVDDCVIHSNSAADGAGVYFTGGGLLTNCIVDWNWASLDGGGLWFDEGGTAMACTIRRNFASTVQGSGGGFVCMNGGLVERCVVESNIASVAGGAYLQAGGLATKLRIAGNHATAAGGGAYVYNGSEVVNCLIYDNLADEDGGGLVVDTSGDIINCTITGNQASNSAGGVFFYDGGACWNTILYGNTAASDSNYYVYITGTVSYSCTTPDIGGTANITNDPAFVSPGDRDYGLRYGSACIDQGTADGAPSDDFDGTARPLDGDWNGPAACDMGCYEYDPETADSNRDGVPDWWYHGYGLDPTNPATTHAHADTDTIDNEDEWFADTNPTDSNDFFHLAGISNVASYSVFFECSTARVYSLESASDLVLGDWLPVDGATNFLGDPTRFMSLTDPGDTDSRSYRLTVGLPAEE